MNKQNLSHYIIRNTNNLRLPLWCDDVEMMTKVNLSEFYNIPSNFNNTSSTHNVTLIYTVDFNLLIFGTKRCIFERVTMSTTIGQKLMYSSENAKRMGPI